MPNEYDDLVGDIQTSQPTNEYHSILDAGPALVRAQNAEGTQPDEAAQALAASKRLGVPYAVGALDPRDTIQQSKRQAAKVVIQANPFIQQHIEEDPAAAQVSQDDWHVLDKFTSAWNTLTDPDGVGRLATMMGAPDVATGAKRGFAQEAMGLSRAGGDKVEAQKLEDYADALPPMADSGFRRYADLVGGFVGQLAYQASAGGLAGAGMGAGAGAFAAGPPGILAGGATGLLGGITATAGEAAYGRTLMALDKAEAESGQALSPFAKQAAAGTVGLLAGGANLIGIKAVGGAATELLADAAAQAVVKPGVAAALGRMGTSVVKGGATASGLMAGLTAADAVLQDAAKAASPGEWQTILNSPERRMQLVGDVGQALADGFVLGGALHALPAGKNFANDLRLTKEAAADKANLQGLIDTRAESATAQRSPDSFEGFASLHGDEKLVITPEGVEKLPPEVQEGMALKVMPDGSAEVPLATYAAKVPEDVHARIADDIVHREDGVSVAEAKDLSSLYKRGEETVTVFHGSRKTAPSFNPERSTYQTKAVWFSTDRSTAQGFVGPDGKLFQADVPLREIFDPENPAQLEKVSSKLAELEVLGPTFQKESALDAVKRGYWSALEDDKVQAVLREAGFKGHIGTEGENPGQSVAVYDKSLIGNPREADSGMAPAKDVGATPQPLDAVAEAQVAEARQMYLEPLFQGPTALMMQTGEFARYSKLLEARAESIRKGSERRAAADAKARLTPDYLAREADMRDQVTEQVDRRPDFQADRMIREEGLKLDREVVDALGGAGAADRLKGSVKKGGVHPDEVAGMAGYTSGAEMVQDLISMRAERDRAGLSPKAYREAVIAADTKERMLEAFGDLPENIQREAREAAVMPAATEILDAEREALAAHAGGKPAASLAELREQAAAAFAETKSRDALGLADYMRAVGRAGRRAELALLKGDFAAAFLAKQQQMQAHLFAEQAKAFGLAQRQLERRLKPYVENPTVTGASQRYVNQVQGLLSDLSFGLRRDAADLKEMRANEGSLGQFVADRNGDLGGLIPDADLPTKGFADYTVQDMRQFQDLVQALDFQGRAEQKLKVGAESLALDDAVKQAVTLIKEQRDRYDPAAKGLRALLATLGRKIDAPMLKMEQLLEWFDKSDPNGLFHKAVVQPLHEAQGKRDDMFVALGKQLRALGGDKKWNKSLGDSITNTTLMDPFHDEPRPYALTRKEMLGIMLNTGSPSNFEVLAKGMKWDKQAINDLVDKHATQKDWQWVQGIWKTFEALAPEIKKTYRELAGVGPEMVEGTPKIFTRFGTVEGGYFPLMFDPLRKEMRGASANDALFQRGQVQPLPANGYTKQRTGATYPLQLNTDFIAAQLRATAHDLAFRGPIIEANKFLNHPEVLRAVKQTFGPEYAAEFGPYLRDIANDGVADAAGISALTRMSAGARAAVVNSLIGFNLGTVYIHGGSAALNSIGELANQNGWKAAGGQLPKFLGRVAGRIAGSVAEASYNNTVARWTKSPVSFNKGWHDALTESVEMRNRLHNFDRDLAVAQDVAIGKNDRRRMWNSWATGMVAYSDLLTAVPTYMAARDMALANGKSAAEAIAIGEKTVRQAHGSSGIVDRARIQRGSEFQKWFTMFFGYFSHNYNRNRDTWRMAMEGKEHAVNGAYAAAGNAALKVTSAAIFYAMLPAVNHARIRHSKEDDEHYGRWMAKALFTQATGDLPFVRDIGSAMVSGRDAAATPMATALDTIAKTGSDILAGTGVSHDTVKHGALKRGINTAGLVTGTATRQIGTGAQFLLDTKNGLEHPEGFYEWYHGLVYGHAKQRKH